MQRCRHPPTTSNDPSPSGYCLHFNSRGNCSRICEYTSNQARAFPHTSQNTHRSNIVISEAIAAPLPSTGNAKRFLTIRLLCLHFSSCGNRSRTRKDTSNQTRYFPHTPQNIHRSNITISEVITAPLPSTHNVKQSLTIRLLPVLQLLRSRTREDTSNQTRYFLHIPQNMHQSNIAILEAIAALPPSTHNVKRSLAIRLLCLHFNSCT